MSSTKRGRRGADGHDQRPGPGLGRHRSGPVRHGRGGARDDAYLPARQRGVPREQNRDQLANTVKTELVAAAVHNKKVVDAVTQTNFCNSLLAQAATLAAG